MDGDVLALEEIKALADLLTANVNFLRTPLIRFETNIPSKQTVLLKCENLQFTGSFKYRGVVSQFHHLLQAAPEEDKPRLVTMSAGNYGKAFAMMCASLGMRGTVLVPSTCSTARVELMQGLGVDVEQHASAELENAVMLHVKTMGQKFLHPFDDKHLLLGYASLALELLEDLSDPGPGVILVGCGGGGLLAAVSTCICLSHRWPDCRIYGVEPETANTMWLSLKQGVAVRNGSAQSVARGLAPPYVGHQYCYPLCQQYVDGIILVSEQEIAEATLYLHKNANASDSMKHLAHVEPSGAAAFAAWLFGKIPPTSTTANVEFNDSVCIVISGSNIDQEQMVMVNALTQ